MDSGKLRHRIELQSPIQHQDSYGDIENMWETIDDIWAEIVPLSAREFISANSEQSKVIARITIRHRNDIDHTWRIYHPYKDKYYNIEGILPDMESGLEYLTLACSYGVRDNDRMS